MMARDTQSTWPARAPVLAGFATLLALIGGLATWAGKADISGAIIAPGVVEVEQNRQVVQHPDGGVVLSIDVGEGDLVSVGQTLMQLDPAQIASTLTIVEGQLFEVMARRARLMAERDARPTIVFGPTLVTLAKTRPDVQSLMDGQSRLFTSRNATLQTEVRQLGKRIGQITRQISAINAQRDALRRQLFLIRQELENQNTLLEKGLTQGAKVLSLQRDEADVLGRLGALAAIRAESEGRITETEIEMLKLSAHRREAAITQLRDLQYTALELGEKRSALQAQIRNLNIRAPVSGVVLGMQVFAERAVVSAAQPVLYIVPQDRPLVIAAQIDPIHIDEVFVTQPVVLRFGGFDQRRAPVLAGVVAKISADTFRDATSQSNFYRVEIHLAEGEIAKLPAGVSLIPGMPVDGFIQTAERTLLTYLIAPLTDYFSKAFRES